MEKLVSDLKKIMAFKDTVDAGDIVLIAAKKPQMLVYALISDIVRDDTKREEWWHVSMHLLSLPPQRVTWTLRTGQMCGLEIFTMDGEERFMKAVAFGTTPKTGRVSAGKKITDKSSLRRVK